MSFAQAFASTTSTQQTNTHSAKSAQTAPSIRKKYKGSIVFALGEFGDVVVIRATFPNLPTSVSFQDHLTEFATERATEEGKVYRFDGTYMLFKNGNPSFKGDITQVC